MKNFGKKKEILIFTFIICVLVFCNLFPTKVRNLIYFLSEPLQKICLDLGQGISGFFDIFLKAINIEKENSALLLENQRLKSQIAALREIKKENEALKTALELNLQEDFRLLLSYLVSKDPFQDSILIDKGKTDGLKEGMAVMTPNKVLLGKIEKVYDNFSSVMLITNGKSSFPGKIQVDDAKEITGIVKGGGNFELFFDLIPQDTQIQPGKVVVTVSLEGIFPSGIFVGEVENVEKSDLKPYQKAKIKPAFELEGLDTIFVILEY